MRPLLLVTLLVVGAAPASAGRVGVRLRGDCRRPLPEDKTWTPCAAAHALNMIVEADFLVESREAERLYWAQPQPSTAVLACVDDNAIEYLHEREDLLKDLERIRTWAEAAKDIAAEVEDPSCVESAGGYMVGGEKSDHPKKMAMNIGASVWMMTRYHGKARERLSKKALSGEEEAAALKEAKEFDWQRGFLLSQLTDLEAWTQKAVSPGAEVYVKDEAPKRFAPEDFQRLADELKGDMKRAQEALKDAGEFLEESEESKKEKERFLETLERLKRPPPPPLKPGSKLRPLKPEAPKSE